jgi:hypothetical protein
VINTAATESSVRTTCRIGVLLSGCVPGVAHEQGVNYCRIQSGKCFVGRD